MSDQIEIIEVAKLVPARLKKKGVKLLHYEGKRAGKDVQLTLRETCHMEGSYLPKAMAIFAAMVANAKPQEHLLLMHLLYEIAQGRQCNLVDLDGETLIRFPDQRGDPKHDLYVQITAEPEGPKPAPKTGRKRKASKAKQGKTSRAGASK